MTRSTNPLAAFLSAHGSKFACSVAIGATLALGVRSLFVSAVGTPQEARADSAADHHDEPGHEGHAHPATTPPADEKDEHAGHGKKAETESDGGAAGSKDKGARANDTKRAKQPTGVLLDLGNELCPVMGGAVDSETFSEWNGLRVGHCCAGCNERFLKNPESLLDEVAPKWRDAAKAAEAIDAAPAAERKTLLSAAAKRWSVVRQPTGKAKPAPAAGLLVDLGNTACPVMGGDVDGETFTEWNGLRVGHCCPGCEQRFLKNPEKLLDEVAPKWREAAAAVEQVNAAQGDARAKALAGLSRNWDVVRQPAPDKSE